MYQSQSETVIASEMKKKIKSNKTLPFYSKDKSHDILFLSSMVSSHLVCMETLLKYLIMFCANKTELKLNSISSLSGCNKDYINKMSQTI